MQSPRPISFRGVFLFTTSGDIAISQRFSTVESRVPKNESNVPSNSELNAFVKKNVIPVISSTEQTIFKITQTMVLVILPIKNFYLSVIPLIESTEVPHIEISASFSLLAFLETISRSLLRPITAESPISAYAPFKQLINQILPFGTPIIHDAYFASQITSSGDFHRFSAGYQTVAPAPVPSWKTSLLFPRPQLELKLKETVIGSIDGENNTFDVYGELRCVASINYLPDITAVVNGLENVESISSHFCLKKLEGKEIVFSPPTGISQLLMWKARVDHSKPPLDGTYKIKEDEEGLHFSLTVTAHPSAKSGLPYLTVQLPFPGRGSLTKHMFQSPGGQLKMSKREATIMWLPKLEDIGSQTLSGTLNFESKPAPGSERLKAFVNIKSKETFTGVSIDKDSVTSVSSSAGLSVVPTIEQSYTTESKKYIFWETPMTD